MKTTPLLLEVLRSRPPELTKCRGKTCRKTIEWVRTLAGRRMPLTHPVSVVSVHERENGELLTIVNADQSHFASCPDAAQFKAKDRKKGADHADLLG